MRILFVGTPKVAADTLRQLLTDPSFGQFEVAAVLTRKDAPNGRKKLLTQSPVADVADEFGIQVVKSNRVDDEALEQLLRVEIDVAIVVAYGALIGAKALASIPKGWYNLHYSLLPKYRGAAPVQWALINGERETGVTLFKLDEGMDTGPILATAPCLIESSDDAASLLEKLRLLGASLLCEALPMIRSGIGTLQEQSITESSLAPKLSRKDAEIRWESSSARISNLIRGMNPEPGAFTLFRGIAIKIIRAKVQKLSSDTEFQTPGEVFRHGKALLVRCGDGFLELISIQPAGKKEMRAADWLSGLANAGTSEIVFGASHGE